MAIVGYGRVSTRDQDLTLQHQALRAAGCTKIYSEKMSGARGDRPQLARMLKALEPSDVVIVTRLDRLARSTRDLLGLLDAIKERGAKFKSIAEPIIDTSDTAMGQFVVTLLGAIGQFERSLIMARTQDGIRRAREQGVAFGRPGRLNPRQKKMIAERHAAGATIAELSREFEVGAATVWRALHANEDGAAHSTDAVLKPTLGLPGHTDEALARAL